MRHLVQIIDKFVNLFSIVSLKSKIELSKSRRILTLHFFASCQASQRGYKRGVLGKKTVELLSKSRRALSPTALEKLSSAADLNQKLAGVHSVQTEYSTDSDLTVLTSVAKNLCGSWA